MSGRLEGKVAVITGAAGGIGAAAARRMAQEGARLLLTDADEGGARRVAQELGSERADALGHDVTSEEQWQAVLAAALQAHGRIDVMINNAGLMPQALLERLQVDEWDRMIDVNIKGVLYGIAAALPVFSQAGLRAFRQHRLDCRIDHPAGHGGLFRHKVRRPRHLGGLAPGGPREAQGDDHYARLRFDGFHRQRA